MKVLFLSVTAGHGHNQTAKAAMSYLQEKQIDCMMLDTFEYINPILSESIARGYLVSTKFTPKVYGKLYRIAEKKEKSHAKLSINKLTDAILSRKLVNFLKEYEPDVIVCTHVFAAQIVSHLDSKKWSGAKTIGIITDYTIHPFWEDTNLDYYITANEQLHHQVTKKGIPLGKVKPIGIPIHMKFAKKVEQSEARKMLGVEDKDTLFIMGGSMGYVNVTPLIRMIDSLDLDFQIISVCGNNKRLKRKIDALQTKKRIYNFGFVDNVDIIMDASNLIVSKPGGLTVSESLAKGLPMILIDPIPGQEDRNVEFLLNNGLAINTSETFPIDEAIFQLMGNDWRLAHLSETIKHIGRPNSSKDLGDFIISLRKSSPQAGITQV